MEYTRRLYNDFIDVKDEQSIATMKKRCGYFNDSVITKFIYTSGSSRSDQNSLHPFDDLAELKVTIESQINQGMKIILIFENIIQFNLSPANINIDSIMSQPFIYYDGDQILFSIIYPKEEINENTSKENTWIRSRGLKYHMIHA